MLLDLRRFSTANIIFTNLNPETSHRQRAFKDARRYLPRYTGQAGSFSRKRWKKEEEEKAKRSGIPRFERTLSRGLGLGLVYSPSVLSVALLFAGAAPYSTGTARGLFPRGRWDAEAEGGGRWRFESREEQRRKRRVKRGTTNGEKERRMEGEGDEGGGNTGKGEGYETKDRGEGARRRERQRWNEKGIERMERERREVGKGVRGVVQFRVGITLDFRGDVATSAALSLLCYCSASSSWLLLRRGVLCFAVSMCGAYTRTQLHHLPARPDAEKEQPPGLSGRDRSFRAP